MLRKAFFDSEALNTLCLCVILSLSLVVESSAVSLPVCSNGCDYSGIQMAVNAASSGDYIDVKEGVYNESLIINKSLTLKSEKGADKTVIELTKKSINITVDHVTIHGFTMVNANVIYFSNCKYSNFSGNNVTEWISFTNSSDNVIYDNHIKGVSISDKSENNKIFNNVFGRNEEVSISSFESSNCTIVNNRIYSDGSMGIAFYKSPNSTIFGNEIINPVEDVGLNIWYSSNCMISNNNINSRDKGIYLDESYNVTFLNNTVKSVYKGIEIYGSYDNFYLNNTLINGGIFWEPDTRPHEEFFNDVLEGNLVNGNPFILLRDEQNIEITNAGQIILVNCNNITLRSLNITNILEGIAFCNTNNSQIMDSTISLCDTGIDFWFSSSNNTVSENNIISNRRGIILGRSYSWADNYFNLASANLFLNNNESIFSGSKNEISRNHFFSETGGISVIGSDNIICDNNAIPEKDNFFKITVTSSSNIICNNTFFKSGLSFERTFSKNLKNNTVYNNSLEGKQIVYLENESNIVITNASQLIVVGCNNITVKDLIISNTSRGIQLLDTQDSLILGSNISSNTQIGIALVFSSNITIEKNEINSNLRGIYLYGSTNNQIIENNIFSNDIDGIQVAYSSYNNSIVNNTFKTAGINTIAAENIIENNTLNSKPLIFLQNTANKTLSNVGQVILFQCQNITICGTNISNTNYGIVLLNTNKTRIHNNTISNDYMGIYASNSFDNVFTRNQIILNTERLHLYSSQNNSIYDNYFNNSMNAYSASKKNHWNTTKTIGINIIGGKFLGGNFWSDYSGIDINGDGIGDTPRQISEINNGIEYNTDHLPLTLTNNTCEINGDNPPCNEVTVSEIVSLINLWIEDQATLSEVITLINVWQNE